MFLTVFSHVVLSQMQMPEILMSDKAMWLLLMKLLTISLNNCVIFDRQENNHIILNLIFVKNCLKQNSRNSSSTFFFFLISLVIGRSKLSDHLLIQSNFVVK